MLTTPGVLRLGWIRQLDVSVVPCTWVAVAMALEYVKLTATPLTPVVLAIETGTIVV
jgi:hypothetical protein